VKLVALIVALLVVVAAENAMAACTGTSTPLAERTACRQAALAAVTSLKANALAAGAGTATSTALTATPTAADLTGAIKGLADLAVTFSEAFQTSHCADDLVICLDRTGELASDERWPHKVRPDDKLTIVVLTPDSDDQGLTSVTVAGRASDEQLFPTAVDQDTAKLLSQTLKVDAPTVQSYLALTFPSDPVTADDAAILIEFTRTGSSPAATTHSLDVDLGFSYFSVALMVAVTYMGDRRVLRDLETVSDHAVDPGLALNFFPGGRQIGVIGYLRKCHLGTWAHARRCIANNVGLQIGTSLDLTSITDRLYAGIVFEPIAGLALVGGASLRKVDVVPAAGALPGMEASDGTSPTDQRYVIRGYVGVTITLDLLNTIAQTGAQIKKLSSE
jgi:hypothetical protein